MRHVRPLEALCRCSLFRNAALWTLEYECLLTYYMLNCLWLQAQYSAISGEYYTAVLYGKANSHLALFSSIHENQTTDPFSIILAQTKSDTYRLKR